METSRWMEEEFMSFLHEEAPQQRLAGPPRGSTTGSLHANTTTPRKGLLSGVPKIVWLIAGALLLFGVIFWLYYSRRKQTTQIQKQDNIKVIMGQLKDLQTEMDTIQQKQTAMMGHIRNVASHSQTVESTLSQALADWTNTFDTLRSQIEIVEDGEEVEEEEEEEEEEAAAEDEKGEEE